MPTEHGNTTYIFTRRDEVQLLITLSHHVARLNRQYGRQCRSPNTEPAVRWGTNITLTHVTVAMRVGAAVFRNPSGRILKYTLYRGRYG